MGVTETPEVMEFLLSPDDKFAVVASDGIWEFLSNERVSEIVMPFYEQNQPEAAANALVKVAHERWKEEEEVVDDITVVIIFFDTKMAYNFYQKAL